MKKKVLVLLIMLFVSAFLFAQHISYAEKAFISIVREGLSSSPDYVVITIHNENTGQSKEICTSIIKLYEAVDMELEKTQNDNPKPLYLLSDDEKIKQYLLARSTTRTFDIKNKGALKLLEFDDYQLNNAKEIDKTIADRNLIKKLFSFLKYKAKFNADQEKYYNQRKQIAEAIYDSIEAKRPLTVQENTMLYKLPNSYYSNHLPASISFKKRDLSEEEKYLMQTWPGKIAKYRASEAKEQATYDQKFNDLFKQYTRIYGISFLHILFKYGVITYHPDLSFDDDVKEVLK